MSVAGSVIDAVVAAVATVSAAIPYTFDFTVDGAIMEGDPPDTSTVLSNACAFVSHGDLNSAYAPELGRYRRDFTVQVYAFVPAPEDSPKSRSRVALQVLSAISAAIETDRSLGGVVLDLTVQGRAFTGKGWGAASMAFCIVEVAVYWWADSAGGV